MFIGCKRFFTLLILLSLFGQAIAGGVMSCQMDTNDNKVTATSLLSHCDQITDSNTAYDSEHVNHSQGDCNQECSCCLGACTSSVFSSENALTIPPASLVRIGYNNQALINRSESLYRPPITC